VQVGVQGREVAGAELVEVEVADAGDEVAAAQAFVALPGAGAEAGTDPGQPLQQVLADQLAGRGDVAALVDLAEGRGEPAGRFLAGLEAAA
jgi:hypothetical protein